MLSIACAQNNLNRYSKLVSATLRNVLCPRTVHLNLTNFFFKCELWRKVESGTKNIGESVKIYLFFFFFGKLKDHV